MVTQMISIITGKSTNYIAIQPTAAPTTQPIPIALISVGAFVLAWLSDGTLVAGEVIGFDTVNETIIVKDERTGISTPVPTATSIVAIKNVLGPIIIDESSLGNSSNSNNTLIISQTINQALKYMQSPIAAHMNK